LKAREREKEEAMHIEDRQRSVLLFCSPNTIQPEYFQVYRVGFEQYGSLSLAPILDRRQIIPRNCC
jgi:hypothetical protein